MRSVLSIFQRMVRKAHRDTGLAIVAVAINEPDDGGPMRCTRAADGATPDQLLFAAEGVLALVVEEGGDPNCPCCVERIDRAKAALAAMRAEPGDAGERAEPVTHLH